MYQFTPEVIEKLNPNEIFVFGSNMRGIHISGAALLAYNEFNAIFGQSQGLQGRSYAIPTLDENFEKVSEEFLEWNINKFIDFVINNKQLTFYLTKIGCGIAEWDTKEVRRIFWRAMSYYNSSNSDFLVPNNLYIPKEFYYEEVN